MQNLRLEGTALLANAEDEVQVLSHYQEVLVDGLVPFGEINGVRQRQAEVLGNAP
jgi:hypothetical protein